MRKNQKKDGAKSVKRKNKSKEALQFSEDRLQLLDTIHEMVSDELQHRGLKQEGNPHAENPPPDGVKKKDACPLHTASLWQRFIKTLFLNRTD